jgi:hypothetical protein
MKLTKNEVALLRLVFRHLADHCYGDDRPDHGLNRLKDLTYYRDDVIKLYRRFENSYKHIKEGKDE